MKSMIYVDNMSHCISWVSEFCIFRLTERNNILPFEAAFQKRYNFRILRVALAYFLGKTPMWFVSVSYTHLTLPTTSRV